MIEPDWTQAFEGLSRLSPDVLAELRAGSTVMPLTAGTRVFGPGKSPAHYTMLLDGVVRVSQVSAQGREIVLYRIHAGQTCALTTVCLMGLDNHLAEAVVEEAGRAVAVPRQSFDALIARSPEFRRFVFSAFSARITDLFKVVEEVAFQRVDIRLAQRLLQQADASGRVAMTHQRLAAELGSAREVISRQLKEFRRREWVSLARGHVDIRDRHALETLSKNG